MKKINVGVIGLGMMGTTHLDVYTKRDDVNVIAISDIDPDRLSGASRAGGNIKGQAGGRVLHTSAARYDEGMKLIADPEVDLVDICLPTPLHLDFAIAALLAGKHVLVEKPITRNAEEAKRLIQVARTARGYIMPAMCMRFWPGWDWLKKAIDQKTYGKVLSATFRRVSSHPGGPFYRDGEASGGAILDLHIHDVDFILHCFGMPEEVNSFGYSKTTSHVDHVVTQYKYKGIPLVLAEGGWDMADGYGFSMRFTVNFEHATADFDLDRDDPLMLSRPGHPSEAVQLRPGHGYEYEISYFLDCIAADRAPKLVSLEHAAEALVVAEAECESVQAGRPMRIHPADLPQTAVMQNPQIQIKRKHTDKGALRQ